MSSSFFELNTYCDADNAPNHFRHGPEVKKLCQYCGKRNPLHRAITPQSDIPHIDLTGSPTTEAPQKTFIKKEKAPRPTQRVSSSRTGPAETQAMITHPPEYVHGEGEKQRQESIRLAPSKKNKPTIIDPIVTLVMSVYRMTNGGCWLDQKLARLVIVPNDEYDYSTLILTCLTKLRAASRRSEVAWLDGDLENWQLASQSHKKEKGIGHPTTVYFEGSKRLSDLVAEWDLQLVKNSGKQYRLFLYHFMDEDPPQESNESDSDLSRPLVKKGEGKKATKKDKRIKDKPTLNMPIKKEKIKQEPGIKKEKESHKRALSSAEHPYGTRYRPKPLVKEEEEGVEVEEEESHQTLPIRGDNVSADEIEDDDTQSVLDGQSEDDPFTTV